MSVQAPQGLSEAATVEDSDECGRIPLLAMHPPLQTFSTWRVPWPVKHR